MLTLDGLAAVLHKELLHLGPGELERVPLFHILPKFHL